MNCQEFYISTFLLNVQLKTGAWWGGVLQTELSNGGLIFYNKISKTSIWITSKRKQTKLHSLNVHKGFLHRVLFNSLTTFSNHQITYSTPKRREQEQKPSLINIKLFFFRPVHQFNLYSLCVQLVKCCLKTLPNNSKIKWWFSKFHNSGNLQSTNSPCLNFTSLLCWENVPFQL